MLKEIGTNERSFLIDFAASVLPLENRDKTEKRLYLLHSDVIDHDEHCFDIINFC